MSSAITGKDGTITTTSGVTEVKNITLDEVTDIHDATSWDSDGWHEYIEGLQGATGSGTAIGTKPTRGADAALAIYSGANTWSGAAKIHEISIGMPVDDIVTYDFTFTYTGEVTIS